MKLIETDIPGAFLMDIEPHRDERGFFARTFCLNELANAGVATLVSQASVSYNEKRGTLRGMHFQVAPDEEEKVVRCTSGAVFDVVVDVRRESPCYGRWFGAELTAANRRAMFVPKGCAHGFLSLEDHSEVLYLISHPYAPGSARGFRWDDPEVGIRWPLAPAAISTRDSSYPRFAEIGMQ